MTKFKKIPLNKHSTAKRRIVYGVGTNDAWYKTEIKINGERIPCPAYRVWIRMLERCYSEAYQERKPTYVGCAVCNEWLSFSCFADWFEENYIDGYQLDKDISVKGNKLYSPATCKFVTLAENTQASTAKTYTLVNPKGVIVTITNMRKFCRENNLAACYMYCIASGKQLKHKGWSLPVVK